MMNNIDLAYLIICLIILIISFNKDILSNAQLACPHGFSNLTYRKHTICIQFQKNKTYSERYTECKTTRNILSILTANSPFNIKFAQILTQRKIESIWLNIGRSYEDGPFINMDKQKPTSIYSRGNLDCLVTNSSFTFYPEQCNNSVHNVCLVEPFDISSDPHRGPCKENFTYYPSPTPACLTKIYEGFDDDSRGKIESFCENLGGKLLGKGLIYRRNIAFSNSTIDIPLDSTFCNSSDDIVCSGENKYMSMNAFGQINNQNENFTYSGVICEHPIKISKVELKLSVNEKRIVVFVDYIKENNRYNYNITTNDFSCYTDAETYYPIKVNTSESDEQFIFNLDDNGSGYYWCDIKNTSHFEYYESNRIFFIKDIKYISNVYVGSLNLNTSDYMNKNLKSYERENYFYSHVENSTAVKFLEEQGVSYKIFVKKAFFNGTLIFHIYIGSPIDDYLTSNKNLDYFEPFLFTEDVKKGFFVVDFDSLDDYIHKNICKGYKKVCYCMKIKKKSLSSYIYLEQLKSDEEKCMLFSKTDYILQVSEDFQDSKNYSRKEVENIINNINAIETMDQSFKVPISLYKNLNNIILKLILNSSEDEIRIPGTKISVAAFKTRRENPILGIKVKKDINETLNIGFFDKARLNETTEEDNEVIVEIPSISPNESEAISIQTYSNENIFEDISNRTGSFMNSKIISVSAVNSLNFIDGQFIYIGFKPLKSELGPYEEKLCVFMDFEKKEWSGKGCELIERKHKYDMCRCNHMTHYGIISRHRPLKISEHHYNALTIITYIGISLSLFGLISIAVTAVIFEQWRNQFSNKVYLNMSAAIGLVYLTFFVNSFLKYKSFEVCLAIGAFLHYNVLVSFCWMFITATRSYKKLVLVFDSNDTSHRLMKAFIFGWIMPLMPVIILLIVDHNNYFRKGKNSDEALFCFPQEFGFWFSVFLPAIIVVSVNIAYYLLIVKELFFTPTLRHDNNRNVLRTKVYASLLMFFLFGLTWLFGFFSNYMIMNYLFCITGSIQGFVFFVFFILGSQSTRNMYEKNVTKIFNQLIRNK